MASSSSSSAAGGAPAPAVASRDAKEARDFLSDFSATMAENRSLRGTTRALYERNALIALLTEIVTCRGQGATDANNRVAILDSLKEYSAEYFKKLLDEESAYESGMSDLRRGALLMLRGLVATDLSKH